MKKNLFESTRHTKKNEGLFPMKHDYRVIYKSCLLLLLIIVLTIPVFAQWTTLNSGITNTLRAPYFTSENVGVVVGEAISPDQAPILKTTDGGLTWVPKVSGTINNLRAVQFTDANTGFAVGFSGTILKTTNAGETWSTIASGTTQALRSVSFPSANIGYIAGGAGTMLKTTNGGTTWTPQTTNITADLINVRFISNDIGYAVSSTSTFTSGIVIKTTNGGTTWTPVYTNDQGLLGLAVIDANTVYAGGGNNQNVGGSSYIVKTTDGGATWSVVYSGLANAALRGAAFVSSEKGWFVGDFGETPFTNNGGSSWSNDSSQINGLTGVQFPTATVGYAVGSLGTILKYTVPTTCATPTGMAVSSVTATAANLQWNNVNGAIGYKISYHPAGVSQGIKKPSTANSKVIKNLLPSTTYKWAVQSVCSSDPQLTSSFVPGPDFTTPPLRISDETTALSDISTFPNPVSENATISFSLEDASPVTIRLIDLNGKVIREISNGAYEPGNYQISFSSESLTAGLYFLQLTSSDGMVTTKLMIER